ncbi:MAG: hypothetical protein H6916_04825 [Novosphingobium sp.]|uniref:hypothetical protein n=1 Tax=Novosphingobium sp. TaxID=1874826 RepID=UPI001DA7D992|nr:hypothetical protein [Novosphingobium sp.]MCB2058803.1 hypothetical protein [Novosphingobium sp.]MCP5386128.1 hypothetical protein [Novosphingobium sp.]HNJ47049.1 hypothetical protein [Novosphingobium sp.]HNN55035.1 hypothetical protein [Novosphingobium sp.]
MRKIAVFAMSAAAALALAGCGKSDSAKDGAEADNVEMPAEEAVTDVDATPAADASAEPGADAAAPAPAAT